MQRTYNPFVTAPAPFSNLHEHCHSYPVSDLVVEGFSDLVKLGTPRGISIICRELQDLEGWKED